MDVLIDRCAGLDVHQATVVATVRYPGATGRASVTENADAEARARALREWRQAYGVRHVALESTGVYWNPVYYLLEDGFTLLLINMQTLKHVPGRKTDVNDSEWLAQRLECGLLRASFVPPPAIRELRAAREPS
jgi:transposase